MNEYLTLACALISIVAAFVKNGTFNRIFCLFLASIFIILMLYKDLNKIFIAVIISFAMSLMLILTCKEYKRS
jgi:hypothetical protein